MKILVVSEAHWLCTGYALCYKHICESLHKAGHEVFELACYGNENIREHLVAAEKCEWTVYLNIPDRNSKDWNRYVESKKSDPATEHGSWNFNQTVLDCMPDVVLAIRDHWYDKFIIDSPLRKYYNVILSPTVDSMPLKADWIDTYGRVDKLTSYNQWSENWLKTQMGTDNIVPHISPGIHKSYKPLDIRYCRSKFKIPFDQKVLLTVMRNQGRKRYPELFEALSKTNDVYLHCHCHYLDRYWDLPKLASQYGVDNRVYFTYKCKSCKDISVDFYMENGRCTKCGGQRDICSVQDGIETDDLNLIYNNCNMYVQWANCLKPDQEVLIKRDNIEFWCPISKVQIGDLSWTHKNRWRKVLNVWKNLTKSINKKVLDLHMCGDFEILSCTENHEFPAITKNEFNKSTKKSVRVMAGELISKNKQLVNHAKYELKDLSNGDLLLYPIDMSVENIDNINVFDKDNNIFQNIIIDNNFCKFVGLFAADGSWQLRKGTKNIQITCNIDEMNNIQLVKNIFSKIAPSHKITEYKYKNLRNAINLIISSEPYANLFSEWFLKHENKKLPDWTMKLPIEKQKQIIIGMFMGDGHYDKLNKCSIYTTVSLELARQLKHLLRRCKIQFASKIVNRANHKNSDNKNRKNCYRFEIYGSNIKLGEIVNKMNGSNGFYYQDYHLMKINKIVYNNYIGDVYCLEVDEDHTMTTRVCTTYQSEGFGISPIEAAACGKKVITVDYSAQEDVGDKVLAHKIKPLMLQREVYTLCNRAIPDNFALADYLNDNDNWKYDPKPIIESANQNYNWENNGSKWVELVESLVTRNCWGNSPNLINPPSLDAIQQFNNVDFVKACILSIIQDESLLGSHFHAETLERLNKGNFIPHGGDQPHVVNKQTIYNHCIYLLEERVKWEREKNRALSLAQK